MTKLEVLRKYFGHESFRGAQEQLIDAILEGRDCVGVMPTGAGKSVCFQLPAMLLNGTAIVISPLISLMVDQVDSLVQNGISAVCINSTISESEFAEIYQKARRGFYKIIYAAPERLESERFSELVKSLEIPLVAIDEAHCVSQWGQDFRPSYLKIATFVQNIQKRPVVAAFTATATERVREDIVGFLALQSPLEVTAGFDRPNLYFEVRTPADKRTELSRILSGVRNGTAIVYCSTRKNVEDVCDMLRRQGLRAGRYHAGLDAEERARSQEDFLFDRLDVMVATNAFGMGIDKPNVRVVVHYNCPRDLESYYQEAGRAGRDGGGARCILLYGAEDRRVAEYMIDTSRDGSGLSETELEELKKRDKMRLDAMLGYCGTRRCLRNYILNYFGENTKSSCGFCGNCTNGDEVSDVTVESQKILSCIFRLKQRGLAFPMRDVCRVLTGELSDGGLDTLSTFGIMRETGYKRVVQIAQYLCAEGYFEECGKRKICVLTPKADGLIKSKKAIVMRFRRSRPPQNSHVRPELFGELSRLRKSLAESLGVPPYAVFSDTTLESMCAILPKNLGEFLEVSEVSAMKAERYGRKFLAVINKYRKTREKIS